MNSTETAPLRSPWDSPPQRTKKLRVRRAEKDARRAEFWGRRLEEARLAGPDAVAAVAWDRARGTLDKLRGADRDRAFEELTRAVDRIREQHAQ